MNSPPLLSSAGVCRKSAAPLSAVQKGYSKSIEPGDDVLRVMQARATVNTMC